MRATRMLSIAAVIAVGACSSDSASVTGATNAGSGNGTTGTGGSTTVTLTARVNSLLAEITSSESAISQGSGSAAAAFVHQLGTTPASLSVGTPAFSSVPADNSVACTLDSATVTYACPAQTQSNGLVGTVSFQFLDANNNPQLHFDTLMTAAIRRISEIKGTTSQPVGTSNGPVPATQITDNTNNIVLGGILTGAHLQNGTGTMKQTIIETGNPDTIFITAPTTTTNLSTSSSVPYPVGGSSTAVVTSIQQGTPTGTTTQVTTFNGTATATLVITSGQGKVLMTCTYNMTSSAAPTCSS